MSDSALRVLVIGNDEATRPLLLRDLKTLGHETAAAEDGAQGVRMALENPPDLIILDLMLDMMGSEAVWEELKKDPTTAPVPVIFCAIQRYSTLRRKLGGIPRVTLYKPFRIEELREAIARASAS